MRRITFWLLITIVTLASFSACTNAAQPSANAPLANESGELATIDTAAPTAPPTATPTITPSPTPTRIPAFHGSSENYPMIEIIDNIDGYQGSFNAIPLGESSPRLDYQWFQDESNPQPLELSGMEGAKINVTIPHAPGEYFINVTAQDEKNNTFTARRLITVTEKAVHVNTVGDHAEWINHLMLYEINAFDWNRSNTDRFIAMTNYLDNLVDLGINTIWLTPIFEGDGLGYWTKDYYKINWMLGAENSFRVFVESAHAKGIRVVLDLVFNHTWSEHPFYLDVLEKKAASPYADWYLWRGAPGESDPQYYYDWANLPNLNVDNPEVQEYLIRVAEYWVIQYNIDGYRCDVATGVEQRSDTFWLNFTRRLKNIKPEIFLLAEAPASPGRWDFNPSTEHNKSILFDDRFAAVYDWDLRPFVEDQGIIGALKGVQSIAQLNSILTEAYPPQALPLRFIENHDLERAAKLLDLQRSKLGHTLIFTVPGVPLIYGGAEQGQTERSEGVTGDTAVVEPFFSRLINARKNYIDNDSVMQVLPNTNPSKVDSYATISNHSIAIATLNFSNQPQELTVDLAAIQAQIAAYPKTLDIFENGCTSLAGDFSSLSAALDPYEASLCIFTDLEAAAPAPIHETAVSPEPSNLLQDGDFANGLNGWTTFIQAGSAMADFLPQDGVLHVDISQAGSEMWHIQLIQPHIPLVNQQTYLVTFTAWASTGRSINVAMQQDGGDFHAYGGQAFTLTDQPAIYQFNFTMAEQTDPAARFVIEMGTSSANVFLDDIVVKAGD